MVVKVDWKEGVWRNPLIRGITWGSPPKRHKHKWDGVAELRRTDADAERKTGVGVDHESVPITAIQHDFITGIECEGR